MSADAPTTTQTPAARPADKNARATAGIFRVIGILAAWSFLSIGITEAVVDLEDHLGHVLLFVPMGIAGIGMAVFAGPLARRVHREPR